MSDDRLFCCPGSEFLTFCMFLVGVVCFSRHARNTKSSSRLDNKESPCCLRHGLSLFKYLRKEIYTSIPIARFTPATRASTSSLVLYIAKLARTVPGI